MNKQQYPIVVIHCVDQSYYGGTYDARTYKFTPSKMCITGHLIKKDAKNVVLALEYFEDHDIRYVSVIPMNTITSMEVLREQSKD